MVVRFVVLSSVVELTYLCALRARYGCTALVSFCFMPVLLRPDSPKTLEHDVIDGQRARPCGRSLGISAADTNTTRSRRLVLARTDRE